MISDKRHNAWINWLQSVIVFVSLILFISNVFALAYPTNQFIFQLKNSDEFIHAKFVGWVVDKNELYSQITNSYYHKAIMVDDEILKIASGVKSAHKVWQFNNAVINDSVSRLFQKISVSQQQLGFIVNLSKYDLFHGHLFAIHTIKGVLDEVGILFHANEYPNDLNLGNRDAKNHSPFNSKSSGYAYRNFIWLASTGLIYDIDSYSHTIYPRCFLPKDINILDPSMREIIKLYLQARTLFLESIDADIESLGDVNYFVMNNRGILFFTY